MSNRQNKLKETIVNGKYYTYDYNYRFVISIREDDLYRLEDVVNINYLSSLRIGRYRLQNLNDDSAMAIVSDVGGEYIDPTNIETISERIVNVAKDKGDGLIQTNTISLVCARLFELFSQNGKKKILLQDVDNYLLTNPFEEYYATAVKKLSEAEKSFIEASLVSADGRRNFISEKVIRGTIKSHEALISGRTPIFHRVQSSLGDNLIELIHDGLCSTVMKNKAIRLEKKNKTIMSICLFIFGIFALWMLNSAVTNDFVAFFLKISQGGVNELGWINILSFSELLFIILCPVAIGSLVYDYRRKSVVAMFLLLLFLLPCALYPGSCQTIVKESVSQIIESYNEKGISGAMHSVPLRRCVFGAYTIATLALCYLNVFGKPGVIRSREFIKIMYKSTSVRIYTLSVFGFLFYESIFNSGYFVIEPCDSCWGLVVIPVLFLCLFDINLGNAPKKVCVLFYILLLTILLLTILMMCSILEIHLPIYIYGYVIIFSLIILTTIYYKDNLFYALLKSVCNIVVLVLVLSLQIGYYPNNLWGHTLCRVYPWKIVEAKKNNRIGVYDAVYGDTLLIPIFNRDSVSRYEYYTILSKNSYIDTVNEANLRDLSQRLPIKLNKTATGEWKLSAICSPGFEHTICDLAHSTVQDSTLQSSKEGAKLYIKLRKDLIKLCTTGDESFLLSDVLMICDCEEAVKRDLEKSIRYLSVNDSVMTEKDIVPFLKSLSRSLYLNSLKVQILSGSYNEFIGGYSSDYCAIILTDIFANNGIKWTNNVTVNINLKLHLDEPNEKKSDEEFIQGGSISITSDDLCEDKIYAWNKLLYLQFLHEYRSCAPRYYANIQKELEQRNLIMSKLYGELKNFESKYKNQNKELSSLLKQLTK